MDDVSVTVVKGGGTVPLAIQMMLPKKYASMLGRYVRPEGDFKRGLVLHGKQERSPGITYKVQAPLLSSSKIAVSLAASYAGVGLASPKATIPVTADATIQNGETLIRFAPVDLGTVADRTPMLRRHGRRPAVPARVNGAELPVPAPARMLSEIEMIRDAVKFLNGLGDPNIADAVVTLLRLAPRNHVSVTNVDGVIAGTVRRDLFE